MINPQPVLAISRLSKTFPGQLALDDVDFEVMGGEIHALVGQNGSGKSTLIKVLAGYHHADPGCSITVDGDPVNTSSPGAGRNAGLRFVHQDLGLVGDLSVIDNLALGRRYRTGAMGRIRWGAEVAAARAALSDLGVHVDPYAPVASLSSAERSIVAITRATHDEVGAARVLILDEPTAALPADDVGRLFGVLRQLRDRGLAIVLVSHHLDEVLAIADRVTVLRDGRRVDTVTRDRVDHDVLVQLIVGRALASADRVVPAPQSAERCFSVAGLVGATIASVSFDVCRGEVVGIAGLDGSGREAVIPLLTGQWPRAAGRVVVLDTAVQSHAPHAARRAGMAFVPSDRGRVGLFPTMSLRENLTISRLDNVRRYGRVARAVERAETRRWIDRLAVATTGTEVAIGTLSGGNQQKVMLGRSMRLEPSVLLLDEPTQGVDVGARSEVHAIIDDAVGHGMGAVVASTDTDELVRLCHRVIVLQRGRMVRLLYRGSDLTVDNLDRAQLAHGDNGTVGAEVA